MPVAISQLTLKECVAARGHQSCSGRVVWSFSLFVGVLVVSDELDA